MPFAQIDESFRMFYESYDFTDPWKPSDVVLLQHGNSRNSETWRWYIPRLSGMFRVVTPDFRGRGRSAAPPPYSLSGWARDLKILRDSLGIDEVRYVGEATGGLIGLQFAHDYPEMVKSLVLIGSGPANQALLNTPTEAEIAAVAEHGVAAWHRQVLAPRFDPEKTDPGLVEMVPQHQRSRISRDRRCDEAVPAHDQHPRRAATDQDAHAHPLGRAQPVRRRELPAHAPADPELRASVLLRRRSALHLPHASRGVPQGHARVLAPARGMSPRRGAP